MVLADVASLSLLRLFFIFLSLSLSLFIFFSVGIWERLWLWLWFTVGEAAPASWVQWVHLFLSTHYFSGFKDRLEPPFSSRLLTPVWE